MERDEVRIRAAKPEDVERLLAIYAPYVEKTAVTFEYDVPSAEEFRGRIVSVLARFPYLAAEKDGEVLGYAYAGPFHSRAAYGWSVETSIYVDPARKRMGLGGKLHRALENVLREQGFLNMNACIAVPEKDDEYLTATAWSFTGIWVTGWWGSLSRRAINSGGGITWRGWKSTSALMARGQSRRWALRKCGSA